MSIKELLWEENTKESVLCEFSLWEALLGTSRAKGTQKPGLFSLENTNSTCYASNILHRIVLMSTDYWDDTVKSALEYTKHHSNVRHY